MGCCNGLSRQRASPSSTTGVMLRKLRRLRVTAIFYTCGGLCAILLLVNFNEDVKRLLQQSPDSTGPHLSSSGSQALISAPAHTSHSHHAFTRRLPHDDNTPPQLSPQDDVIRSLNRKINEHTVPRELSGDEKEENESDLSVASSPTPLETTTEEKPWYMWGGTKYPSTSSISSSANGMVLDEAKLWYEDNLNNDRILEQLMFWIDDPLNNPNSSLWSESANAGGDSTLSTTWAKGAARESSKVARLKSSQTEQFLANIALSTGSVQVPSSGGNSGSSSSSVKSGNTSLRFQGAQRRGKLKTILLYYGLGMSWGSHITSGRSVFLQQKCPVNACRLSGNRAHISKADVVLFKDVFMNPKVKRNPSQLWAMYMLECPLNTQNFVDKNVFNLTATYRHDSDIVTPYEKWVYYDENAKMLEQGVDYAKGKTKKVAWFVSNCVAKNNRLDYARELSKYIEVDIYGACGTHSCSRANAKQCFDLLAKNYKFYLAFENSNCRDYISEKFFVNGLGNNVLPIVMGAHPDDYKRVAPSKSYIHVDDFASPKELAEFLYLLDKNDDLYNEYFQWKGTGEFINTHFFCRLCAMAHYADRSERRPRHYKDFNKWWRGPNVCTRRSWRNQPDIFSPEFYERSTVDN